MRDEVQALPIERRVIEMTELDAYLARYFVDRGRFAALCRVSEEEIASLISLRAIPKPSYVVADGQVTSYVFGVRPAQGAIDGEYFHPGNSAWVGRARDVVRAVGRERAHHELERRFEANLVSALRELNGSTWRLRDCFADDGSALGGLRLRVAAMWAQFLDGTFGLCVANPSTEAAIARKEILQEKLTALTDNGAKRDFQANQASTLLDVIAAYSEAVMPFSPSEYPISSRKRLVDDLLLHLHSVASTTQSR